ncbi:MAG: glycoside hydrolase family 15 protein [Bdellovibrionota bacterium]
MLDYALIGNCQISALIDKLGTYVWCCMPRFDSPSIFSKLLDTEKAGFWSILPEGDYTTTQSYIENTNVVRTRFELKGGDKFEVIDFAPRFFFKDYFFRPPQIIRIIRPISGLPRLRMQMRPVFNYGSIQPQIVPTGAGLQYSTAGEALYLSSDIPESYITGETLFELNSVKYSVLSYGRAFELPLKFGAEEYLDRTINYWRLWAKHCSIPFEFQNEVIRSALALKLHIYEDTGAIIAATTTSIPEGPVGGRCWDYRYCWLRDAYFVINVLNRLGHFDEMENFIEYLLNLAMSESSSHLQPVYGIGGEKVLDERELGWLRGYKGIGPVRVGNAAYTHHQHDVYGEMVLAITPIFFDQRLNRHDQQRVFQSIRRLVEQAIATFDLADAGLWEFRSDHKHYLFSKIMCWAAVDRGVKIAARLSAHDLVREWSGHLARMRDVIDRHGWNEKQGYFAQHLNGSSPDASSLLMHQLNYVNPQDERFKRMVGTLEASLKRGDFIYRYIDKDDFGLPETAFTICSFWMVEALHAVGRKQDARDLFQMLCSKANHVGLLSEDMDPKTGELWGNFPQTYSHVGLISSAMRLSKSWDDAF